MLGSSMVETLGKYKDDQDENDSPNELVHNDNTLSQNVKQKNK